MEKKIYNELRKKAELVLQEKGKINPEIYHQNIEKLLEELSIHQIELEMQNIELQEANERLIIEEEKYRQLYMEAPNAYFTLNSTGNIINLNYKAAKILGKTVHSVNRTSIFPFLEHRSKQQFMKFFKEIFETGLLQEIDLTFINSNNQLIYTKLNAIAYFDYRHNMLLCRCSVTDITKNKQAEQKLKESEERFKAAFKQDKAIKMLINTETQKIEEYNQAALDFYGYSSSDFLTKKIGDINRLSKEEIKAEIQKATQLKKNHFFFKHRLANGEIRHVEVYSTPIKFGRTTKLLSTVYDITQKVKHEQEVKKLNTELKIYNEKLNNEINEKEKAQIILEKNQQHYKALYESANEFLTIKNEPELYCTIIHKLAQLLPNTAIILMKVLPYKKNEQKRTKVTCISGIEHKFLQKVMKLVGYKITGAEYNLLKRDENLSINGKLNLFDNGFVDFFGNQIPITISKTLERLFKLNKIYSIGIRNDDNLHAFIHFFTYNNQIIEEPEFIETYVQQTAIIINKLKTEKALKTSEERFDLAIKATKDGVWDWNLITNAVYFSPNWKKMLGYDDNELENKFETWERLTHPKDVQKTWQQINKLKAGEKEKLDIEIRMKHKNGKWLTILSRANVFFNKQKETYRMVGTHINVTERKAIKQALHDSEMRWKFAIEGNKDGLWDWNLITNEVFFSEQWKNMLGYTSNEITNNINEWDKRIHPDDKKNAYDCINKYMTGETDIYINEHRILCKNGEYKWILDRGKIIDYTQDNKPRRMIGTHTDISQQKQQEIELRNLNATKDKLFSIIAHDLRSPFNSILGLSELAVDKIKNKKYDALEKYCSMVQQATQQTFTLLNNLLDWSRVQTGRIKFTPENIALYETAIDIVALLQTNITQKNIELSFVINENLIIFADRLMLETIIRNLLSNAIKFTPKSGNITIKAIEKENVIQISIQDSGIGISNENIKKLFNIETNYTTYGTEKEKGSGLGLLLCKEFVERHNGKIWVESSEGQGSIFFFTILTQQKNENKTTF